MVRPEHIDLFLNMQPLMVEVALYDNRVLDGMSDTTRITFLYRLSRTCQLLYVYHAYNDELFLEGAPGLTNKHAS